MVVVFIQTPHISSDNARYHGAQDAKALGNKLKIQSPEMRCDSLSTVTGK